jgi:hypothetical protein
MAERAFDIGPPRLRTGQDAGAIGELAGRQDHSARL